MPRYFFNVEDGHKLFDPSGFVCDDDVAAVIRATVLAVGVSLNNPEDDPKRRIAVVNDQGHETSRRGAICLKPPTEALIFDGL